MSHGEKCEAWDLSFLRPLIDGTAFIDLFETLSIAIHFPLSNYTDVIKVRWFDQNLYFVFQEQVSLVSSHMDFFTDVLLVFSTFTG